MDLSGSLPRGFRRLSRHRLELTQTKRHREIEREKAPFRRSAACVDQVRDLTDTLSHLESA